MLYIQFRKVYLCIYVLKYIYKVKYKYYSTSFKADLMFNNTHAHSKLYLWFNNGKM